jgi:transposase
MAADEIMVGVDVSLERLDVALWPSGECFSVGNDGPGVARLLERMPQLRPGAVVVEASGGPEDLLVSELWAAQFPVAVVNPRQVREFARSLGRLAKTDRLDALVLAQFGSAMSSSSRLMLTQLAPEAEAELKALVRRRRQVIEILVAETHRHRQAKTKPVKRSIVATVRSLKRTLAELEQQLRETVKHSPAQQKKVAILLQVPGVGERLAHTLVAEVPELGRLGRRQIASLIGVAPHAHESGKFKGRRMIWGGRAPVRTTLYMAMLSASRCNPVLAPFYRRLVERGKSKKLAYIACARKLLVMLNAMFRDHTTWSPTLDFQHSR